MTLVSSSFLHVSSKHNKSPILLTLTNNNNKIRVLNYPCVVAAAPALEMRVHCAHVAGVRFLSRFDEHGDHWLVSHREKLSNFWIFIDDIPQLLCVSVLVLMTCNVLPSGIGWWLRSISNAVESKTEIMSMKLARTRSLCN